MSASESPTATPDDLAHTNAPIAHSLTPPDSKDHDDKRLPTDKEGILKAKLATNPTSILTYLELIQYYESQENDMLPQIRETFTILHDRFPLMSFLWTIQLKMELSRDEFTTAETILSNCLAGDRENNDLSLWATYLDYIRRKNNLITGGQEARATVIKAFELVVDKCAVWEPQSGQFWIDYLGFLENWKPVNKWEEQQKVDMLRKVYKTMLSVPFDSLERMWNKYTQWEQDINSLTARKFIGELSSDYMKARSLFQEWSNITKNLKRVIPMSLQTVNKNNIPQEDTYDPQQLQIWLNWIKWELENKLQLPEDQLRCRILYVYKQSIQYMVFAPEIWYRYSMYITDLSEREKVLSMSLLANPSSPTITFKMAECFESTNQIEKIQSCFDSCTHALLQKYQYISKEYEKQNEQSTQLITNDMVQDTKRELTFVYCVYMNTMKRLSGLSAARSIFGKCRKLKRKLTHDIYVENAYLEFQNQNDYKTACKVLELGLKYFQTDGIYTNKYLDFLILLNKDAQIKTLFETSVEKVDNLDQLKLIFRKMLNYESKFGNLNNVYSLEKKFLEKFPDENLIDVFTDRYQIQNENLIKRLELTYLYNYEDANMSILPSSKRKYNAISSSTMADNDNNNSNARKRMRSNQEPLIPSEIVELLSILPKRQYFKNALLNSKKLLNFLDNQVEIPSSEKEES
ncbi:hypothetical protein NCAS_0A08160 [Naumovozyma castellii]|uniref:mRNA 3'-end-processing protein RNA14 n=1 Tax=Naumovozyma castellii TaxID=27288 RepID=G0V7C6_NAUCA|nr:hypothetical protein NCAS_0A08160 [Naumovozyma castellii CBS 4309]CCC67374.1 hypothetical protein NCAS_0A08160 [Naumovozyma castellii CBS 4309]